MIIVTARANASPSKSVAKGYVRQSAAANSGPASPPLFAGKAAVHGRADRVPASEHQHHSQTAIASLLLSAIAEVWSAGLVAVAGEELRHYGPLGSGCAFVPIGSGARCCIRARARRRRAAGLAACAFAPESDRRGPPQPTVGDDPSYRSPPTASEHVKRWHIDGLDGPAD